MVSSMHSNVPNKRACTFISGNVCPLTLIVPKRQTFPEINVTLEQSYLKIRFCPNHLTFLMLCRWFRLFFHQTKKLTLVLKLLMLQSQKQMLKLLRNCLKYLKGETVIKIFFDEKHQVFFS